VFWFAAIGAIVLAFGLGYGAIILYARLRFGRTRSRWDDTLFQSVMPSYDVQEQHQIRVAASADATWTAARRTNLNQSAGVRTLVRIRARAMGERPLPATTEGGFVEAALKQGWGLLAEDPGREVILGSVTQPWHGRVVFRALRPEAFIEFRQPDFVKIAWSIRVEASERGCILRTETRVRPTDEEARTRFRRYWSFIMPGMVLIRYALLRMIKREAERSGRPHG
jgi:hypothetical protein